MLGTDRRIDPNKVAVYVRWSTEEQGLGTTLEVQQEACEYYCKSQGWIYRPELLFVDEGHSGGSMTRPALARLRQAVAEGGVECVVVYKLDRLSRNLLDCVTLVRQEWADRCALYSTKENFDTKSSVGQMVFNILVSFAEFERNVIRDRTLSGKRKRAEQGRNAGQIYPYGYVKGTDGDWALDGWDSEYRCFVDRAAIVRRIFGEYLSGMSARSIAERLRSDGVPAPKGGEWRYNSIGWILSNPVYCGQYAYGRKRGHKPTEPYSVVEGAIPAIVTRQEFESVQSLKAERRTQSPRALGSDYLLSGIVRCAKCNGTVAGAGRSNGYRYYACTNRVFFKNCDCGYINADKLEAAILMEVKGLIPCENVRQQVETIESQVRQGVEEFSHVLKHAEESLALLRRKQKRLDEAFFAGHLDGRAYTRLAHGLEADMAEATSRLRQAEDQLCMARGTTVDVDHWVELAHKVDAWGELTVEESKQVVRDIVANLTVYQQKAPNRSKHGNPNPMEISWQARRDLAVRSGGEEPEGPSAPLVGVCADGWPTVPSCANPKPPLQWSVK